MKTKWKDVAHMYLGCLIETPEGVKTLNGIYNEGSHPLVIFDAVHDYTLRQVKPILRPLASMTNEDMEVINDLGFGLSYPRQTITDHDGNRAPTTAYEAAILINILLSKHYDLFGLIGSGQAIDSTTLK